MLVTNVSTQFNLFHYSSEYVATGEPIKTYPPEGPFHRGSKGAAMLPTLPPRVLATLPQRATDLNAKYISALRSTRTDYTCHDMLSDHGDSGDGGDSHHRLRRDVVDAFGVKMSSFHYCVFHDVCINVEQQRRSISTNSGNGNDAVDGRRKGNVVVAAAAVKIHLEVYNPSAVHSSRFDFPFIVQPSEEGQEQPPAVEVASIVVQDSSPLLDAKKGHNGRYTRGTTALIGPSSCCSNPTQYLEPLGALHSALSRLHHQHNSTSSCSAFDVTCIGGIDRVLHIPSMDTDRAAWPDGSWGHHMLRSSLSPASSSAMMGRSSTSITNFMMFNAAANTSTSPQDNDDDTQRTTISSSRWCFEKLLAVGSYYSAWPTRPDADSFRDSLFAYASALKQQSQPRSSWMFREEKNGKFHKIDEKIILVAWRRRSEGSREIADAPAMRSLLSIATSHLPATIGGVIVVKEIIFSDHSFASQAAHVQQADVMIAVHGSDLANIIFMRPHTAVVEIAPPLVTDDRYEAMAGACGLRHWRSNCTCESCAFGGGNKTLSKLRWLLRERTESGITYDEDSCGVEFREFRRGVDFVGRWPINVGGSAAIRGGGCTYGSGCPQSPPALRRRCCQDVEMIRRTVMREMPIVTAVRAAQLMQILHDVFVHLRWMEPNTSYVDSCISAFYSMQK